MDRPKEEGGGRGKDKWSIALKSTYQRRAKAAKFLQKEAKVSTGSAVGDGVRSLQKKYNLVVWGGRQL